MKVLLLNGSPRASGCTFTALSEVASEIENAGIDTEIFQIGTAPIRGCIACGKCRELGKCVFSDDIVNGLSQKMLEADGIVIGTPVYYAGVNGSLISALNRVFYSSRGFAGKPAAAVASCRRAGSTATLDELQKFFSINSMPVVSSSYWNMVHGNTPDEVRQDFEGLQTMRNIGKNMSWLLKCIEAGKAAGCHFPEQDRGNMTNFIR